MNRELTDFEKNTKMLAEQENPYDSACPNRHLYNEGFENGFTTATKIKSTLSALLPENKEAKSAEEILDEEISDNLKNILEQSDTPEDLRSFKRYILDAMERYKGQPALPTKEIIVLEVKFFDNDTVMVTNKNGDTYTSNSEELMDFISHTQKNATPTNKQE